MYQVYIRSFSDGNGDGVGDIAGLRSKLPYLRELGVDAVWINPWYTSPLLDGGYDVADYRAIDPQFGDLDQARDLFADAARLGIRVIVDLVPNHTSWDHAWFRAALGAGPGSPERDRYHFLPGGGSEGSEPPNDWRSVFGGSAWRRVDDGDWYLHIFDISQPDLNWENPEVRREFIDIIQFWLELGAAGFRVDVAHSLIKAEGYPEVGDAEREAHLLSVGDSSQHPFWDRPEVHEIIREWRSVVDGHPGTMMVAEAWLPSWGRLSRYLRSDEYHQAFDFEFLLAPWEGPAMRSAIEDSLAGAAQVESVPTWVLSNHDVVRHATRYGLPQNMLAKDWLLDGDRELLDPELGLRRARAAALLLLALPGSVYLYQGEELGLPEVVDLPLGVLDDPIWERSDHTEKGRDGCRVPIPWETGGDSAGFGDDGSWLPQPEGWGAVSVAAQEGVDGSTLELYRVALSIRRTELVDDIDLEWLPAPDGVLAFRRGSGVRCVVNMGPTDVALDGDVLVASAPLGSGVLPPDTAAWVR